MSIFDSDLQIQRGFTQHRRALASGVNGDGQPLPTDVLEGEIAINLATRKIYTARASFVTTNFDNEITAFENDAGFVIDVRRVRYDSDAAVITYQMNGNTKNIALDSDSTATDVLNTMRSHANGEVGSANVSVFGTELTYYATTGSQSITFTPDFARYIDYSTKVVVRLSTDSEVLFVDDDAKTQVSNVEEGGGGSFRRARGSGTLISKNNLNIFLKNYRGALKVGHRIDQNNPKGSQEVIELNSIPIVAVTPPTNALGAGNLWIKNSDSDAGQLHWLDTSIADDAVFQASLRALSVSDRNDKNLVAYDSDGLGNDIYAEWRPVVSPSLSGAPVNTFAGFISYQNSVGVDSDLIVQGTISAGNGLIVNAGSPTTRATFNLPVDFNSDVSFEKIEAGQLITDSDADIGGKVAIGEGLTVVGGGSFGGDISTGGTFGFDGLTFEDARSFQILNSAGTIVNRFWVLDTDTTVNN